MALMRPNQANAAMSEPETIEELFAALESPLLGYALRLLRDQDSAEDVVQEAFMRLHAQFDEVREPRKWLFRTVHNLALNQRRDENKVITIDQRGTAVAESETPDPQPLPDEQIVRLEGIGLVRLSVETLDARSRRLVHLKFHEGLSYKEISAQTGLTVSHVGYLLHHALKSIADELAKNGIVS